MAGLDFAVDALATSATAFLAAGFVVTGLTAIFFAGIAAGIGWGFAFFTGAPFAAVALLAAADFLAGSCLAVAFLETTVLGSCAGFLAAALGAVASAGAAFTVAAAETAFLAAMTLGV